MNRASHLLIFLLVLCVAGQITARFAAAENFELATRGAGDDVEFLKTFMKDDIAKLGWTLDDHLKTFNPPFDRFSPMLVPHTRYDLNNDGIRELVAQFWNPGDCGSAGCSSFIFQKLDGKWVEIGNFHGGSEVEITEPIVNGWPRLFSHESCLVWNGSRYIEFNNDPMEMGVDPECQR